MVSEARSSLSVPAEVKMDPITYHAMISALPKTYIFISAVIIKINYFPVLAHVCLRTN
jgi:hypothetical protein